MNLQQALHIFRKDARYLRKELALLAALNGFYAWAGSHPMSLGWSEWLLWVASAFVIARLIQAEALAGNKQFWLTRPYHRGNLILAKLLGIIVLVSAPMFVARLYAMSAIGFPLTTVLAPLLWSQFLLFAVGMLPVAALAAVTRSLVPFTFSALGALLIFQAVESLPIGQRFALTGSQWIWDSIAFVFSIVLAVTVLCSQYLSRRTVFSRILMGCIAAIGIVAYIFAPWTTAASIQAALSAVPAEGQSVQLALAPDAKPYFTRKPTPGSVFLDVPIQVSGVPQKAEFLPDGIVLRFRTADGTIWSPGDRDFLPVTKSEQGFGNGTIHTAVEVPQWLSTRAGGKPVSISGELFLTLFGNQRVTTLPVSETATLVDGEMQCRLVEFRSLVCGFPFRWPDRLVYAHFPTTGTIPFTRAISYSPFPAPASFQPMSMRGLSVPTFESNATIVSAERLASLRKHFSFEGFSLSPRVWRGQK